MGKYSTVLTTNKWFNLPDQTTGHYNYLDCLATAKIHTEQTKEQFEHGQLGHYRDVYWPLVEPTMNMARRGLLVDKEAIDHHHKRCLSEIEECQSIVGPDFNLNSPDQRAALLYGEWGLKCPKTTPTGKHSTDQQSLDTILRSLRKKDQHAIPLLHALFHRSRYQTIISRYLKLPIREDGRTYPTIKLSKVETLRLAYADPPIQQFPKEIRDIIVARPGHSFIAADYKQLEARILAILANDETSLKVFREGGDVHTENAHDLGFTNVTTLHRNFAKSFLYKISYGGRAASQEQKLYCPCPKCASQVADMIDLPRKDKVEAEGRWFAKHPAVLRFRQMLERQVRQTQSYTTPFGYKRFFFSPVNSSLPEILNFPMQAGASGLVNDRFIKLDQLVMILIALQAHDEIVSEVPDKHIEEGAVRIKETMEAPVPQMGGAQFPVDLSYGKTWGTLKDLTL